MRIRKTVGIDLGTTNSVIAMLDPTDSTMITGVDEQGRKTFPSMVGYHQDERRPVVGRPAVALRDGAMAPVASVKRFMGLDRLFRIGTDELAPPQVSARILCLLRDMLARTLHDGRYLLDSAIITMPAYFNHNQIEATRQAGELAGFEVVELLHEPTAAAMCYSWMLHHSDGPYLVYDLGGGTFDVSVIRKRYGDYEVLGVSGDPYLGGDDFDRLLAAHLQEAVLHQARRAVPFDLATTAGMANFTRLMQAAEGIKMALSSTGVVDRYVPDLLRDAGGEPVALEVQVDVATFNRLIKEKIDRTIDCCHEALRRAAEKASIRLADVNHVLLVGGSSRIPLVQETVRAAFCNPALPEKACCSEPLLYEPDLCVAYGAALRGATYGTRYVDLPGELELHLTGTATTRSRTHALTGIVSGPGAVDLYDGGSVRVRSQTTGMTEEVFLDAKGSFALEVELHADTDHAFELAICDEVGQELTQIPTSIHHRSKGCSLGQGVLPTQLITKPLQIEVLSRGRQRARQVLAPVGAPLPGVFSCICRTVDQTGRIVVPILEENRLIKQMIIADLDPWLPIATPVEVEFCIDVKHNIEVRVQVRQVGRCETATITAPPPPCRPTRAEIEGVNQQVEELLPEFSGGYRSRIKTLVTQLMLDLHEALRFDDEPKSIQRMAELREVLQRLEAARGQLLDPAWPHFQHLVEQCLRLVDTLVEKTGCDRDELCEHIRTQERYAEQAFEEKNQALYRECWDNLGKYAGYLELLLHEALPRLESVRNLSPEEAARAAVEQFRSYLADVWKMARSKGRADLDERLLRVAEQGKGLTQRVKSDPARVILEARRLLAEIYKVQQRMNIPRPETDTRDAGLLEGMV